MRELLNLIKEKYMRCEYDYNLKSMEIEWLISQAEELERIKTKIHCGFCQKELDKENEYHVSEGFCDIKCRLQAGIKND